LRHKWVILVRPAEARLSVVEISACIEKVQLFFSGCIAPSAWRAIRRYAGRLKLTCQYGVPAVFALDQRLQQDTLTLGDFPLCRLLLSNDSNYPWFILVPRINGISEVFQLGVADQQTLWQETTALAQLLNEGLAADKMNIGALGNVVSQLHVHVIVRKRDDAAWPAPVWGKHPAVPYTAEQVAAIRARLRTLLPADFIFTQG
jgi:diadenosine tetraphosphate (Ap4A) HIT family hydrolase